MTGRLAIPYKLYYWGLPFRGCFVQLLLEHAGVDYETATMDETLGLKSAPLTEQTLPAMAPPFFKDLITDDALAQMPAILMYLSGKHDYLPADLYQQAVVFKILLDCNDVLSELTNANGSMMWNHEKWWTFRRERLPRWMGIFEQTGMRFGLENDSGYLLGGRQATCADIAVTALFGTMGRCLKPLSKDFAESAPKVAALVARIESEPNVRQYIARQEAEYGDLYCGGQIEQSIREMLAKDETE